MSRRILVVPACGRRVFGAGSVMFAHETREDSNEGRECLTCHQPTTRGIVEQRRSSHHAVVGVDCFSCYKANAHDRPAFDRYNHRIAVIVTPEGTVATDRLTRRLERLHPTYSDAHGGGTRRDRLPVAGNQGPRMGTDALEGDIV